MRMTWRHSLCRTPEKRRSTFNGYRRVSRRTFIRDLLMSTWWGIPGSSIGTLLESKNFGGVENPSPAGVAVTLHAGIDGPTEK